jgi:hypothetical protein
MQIFLKSMKDSTVISGCLDMESMLYCAEVGGSVPEQGIGL